MGNRAKTMSAIIVATLLCFVTLAWAGESVESDDPLGGLGQLIQQGLSAAKKFRPLKMEEERAIGKGVAREVFIRYGHLVQNPKLNKYVTMVGKTVAKYSQRAPDSYRFAIIANNEANAFAAPGGYVFITLGLLRKLKSEAELAGVLAHEIAHISKKHMVRKIEKSRKFAGAVDLTSTLLNQDKEALAKVVGLTTNTLFTSGLEQRLEYEADDYGTGWTAAAGYKADGLKKFLTTLHKYEKSGNSIFFQTHPSTVSRIRILDRRILPRHHPHGATLEKRFASNMR